MPLNESAIDVHLVVSTTHPSPTHLPFELYQTAIKNIFMSCLNFINVRINSTILLQNIKNINMINTKYSVHTCGSFKRHNVRKLYQASIKNIFMRHKKRILFQTLHCGIPIA